MCGKVVVKALCWKLKVANSIPNAVMDFLHSSNPSSYTMDLGFIQCLAGKDQEYCISFGVKAAGIYNYSNIPIATNDDCKAESLTFCYLVGLDGL